MKVNVVNVDDVWDFDSGDYSGDINKNKKKAKQTYGKDEMRPVQQLGHHNANKNVKGDMDDIFDDLGEEEI